MRDPAPRPPLRFRLLRLAQRGAAIALVALLVLPELAFAAEPRGVGSLDAMSQAELDRYVQQLNEQANWRRYRRPGDPPDFVPGKPVRVMVGAGKAFGRGGGRPGMQSFRRGGLGSRRGGLSSRRRGGRDEATTQNQRGSSRSNSSFGSSRGRSGGGSSFGGSGSGFGGSGFGGSGFGMEE